MAGVASRLGSGVVLAGWSGCVGVLVVPEVWFGGRGGVAVWRLAVAVGVGCRSGERGDVSVGGEDVGGGGPSVRACQVFLCEVVVHVVGSRRPGKVMANALSACFHPWVPVPSSPPLLFPMLRIAK